MRLKNFYLILAIAGFVGPYYFLSSFLLEHGFAARAFIQQLVATKISTFFVVDLLIASVVFIFYLPGEANRYSIKRWWIYLLALLMVGLSFAWPLFLYVREGRFRQASASD
jgi:hypothetical protein